VKRNGKAAIKTKGSKKSNSVKGTPKKAAKSKAISKKSEKAKKKKTKKKDENLEDEDDSEDEDNLEDLVFPGQKYPTPTLGDPTRAFYESLLEQKPNSLMALKWCIDYGCLDHAKVKIDFFI